MIPPFFEAKRSRTISIFVFFTAAVAIYLLWPSYSTEAKSSPKKQRRLKVFAQVNLTTVDTAALPDVVSTSTGSEQPATTKMTQDTQTSTASNSEPSVEPAQSTSKESSQPAPASPDTTAAASAPEPATPAAKSPKPASSKVRTTPVALNFPSQTAITKQAKSAVSNLSQTFITDLWNPPVQSTTLYKTDAYSPRTTRLLTLASFLLVFSGLAMRRIADHRAEHVPASTLASKKLVISPNN